jgi:hypothetical protein
VSQQDVYTKDYPNRKALPYSQHGMFMSVSLNTDTKNNGQKRGSVSQSQSGNEAELQDWWDGL